MPIPELLTGDIILSTNKSLFSLWIRFFEKLQTGSAEFSHAAAAIGEGLCIEALWRTRINKIEKYEKQTIEIWRLPLSVPEQLRFRREMMTIAGNSYGITKIPLFALDGICSFIKRVFGSKKPCFFFTKKAGILNIPVCSQLVVYGLQKFTDYRLLDEDHKEVPWRIVSPDYLHDLLHHPHSKAVLVHKQNAQNSEHSHLKKDCRCARN